MRLPVVIVTRDNEGESANKNNILHFMFPLFLLLFYYFELALNILTRFDFSRNSQFPRAATIALPSS